MESGPSVRCVLGGVGINFRRSAAAALVVVACDDVVLAAELVAELMPELAPVLDLGELLHPANATPTGNATTTAAVAKV